MTSLTRRPLYNASSAAALTLALCMPASAEASLFQRLGIHAPSAPVSQMLPSHTQGAEPLNTVPPISLGAEAGATLAPAVSLKPIEASAHILPLTEVPALSLVPSTRAQQATPPIMAEVAPPRTPTSTPDVPNRDAANTDLIRLDSTWGQLLAAYTALDGDLVRFDYAGLSQSPSDMTALKTYINSMAKQMPSTLTREQELAYWANLYNAITVNIVAENWPIKSIRKIGGLFGGGPWKQNVITVEGRTLSLDGIEHGTLRKKYKEPRIHYMVNCASVGCPNLKQTPWRADTLEADMTAAAKAFITSPRGAHVQSGKLTTSSIFKWYKEDFGTSDKDVIAHLKIYADTELATALDSITLISTDQYDWTVNAQ